MKDGSRSHLKALLVAPINNLYKAFDIDHSTISLTRALTGMGVDAVFAGYHNLGSMDITAIYDSVLLRYISYATATRIPFPLLRRIELLRLERLIHSFGPDFIITCFRAKPLPKIARKLGSKIIYWQTDLWKTTYEHHLDYMRECDFSFTQFRNLIPRLIENGISNVAYMPGGVDPMFFHPNGLEPRYDFTFVGSYYRDRERHCQLILYPLIGKFGEGVNLFGHKWQETPLAKKATRHGFIDWRRIPKVYSQSKIVLGVYDEIAEWLGAASGRFFEALACKAFFASAPVDGIGELFTPRMDFWPLEEGKDIVSTLEVFLEDEEARNRVAETGYRKVLSSHTIAHRAKQLLDFMVRH